MKNIKQEAVITRQHIIIKTSNEKRKRTLSNRVNRVCNFLFSSLYLSRRIGRSHTKNSGYLKFVIPMLFLFVYSGKISAQAFVSGTNTLNAGIGIGGNFRNYSGASATPGFSVNYERGIWDIGSVGVVSLGGYAGIKSYKYKQSYNSSHWDGNNYLHYSYTTTSKWNYTIIGVRGAFHYNAIGGDKLDLYAGVMLSYNALSYKFIDDDPYHDYTSGRNYGSVIGTTAFVGCRYFVSEHIGFYSEIGYGISYLTIGATLKF